MLTVYIFILFINIMPYKYIMFIFKIIASGLEVWLKQ
jgi:hypothetical protein